jgi:tetratricopeptide (TPR) repeat protein/anti-sigma regulatory factor (Ser/Thr protein kinase)
MIFKMKYFPFFFILLLFFSCNYDVKETSYKEDISKALNFQFENKSDSAFYYYNKVKSYSEDKNANRIVYLLMKEAQLQENIGDYVGSEESATIAIKKYFNSCDSVSYKNAIYNCLGNSYHKMKDYELALKNYKKSLLNVKGYENSAIIRNNIAVIYLDKGDYSKSIMYLINLLKNKSTEKYRDNYARIIDNLGFAYFKNNQKEKGYGYLKESLRIRDSIGNDYEKIASLIHLSRFHKEEDPILAKEFAQKALQSTINVNSPDDKLEALSLLTDLSTPSESKGYFKDYIRINDSITTIRQTAKNQFANIKYESSNAIKDAENQKSQKIIYLLLFVVSVLSGVFIFYFIRKKNKEKLLKTAYDTETRISKRLHDELANDVFNTMMYLETQDLVEQTRKDKVLGNLENIYEKARNISKQTSGVNTGKDFGETIKEMLLSYKSDRVNIIKKGNNTIKWETVAIEKQIEIHRVLQEVLVNMKKHSEATLVVIVFETLEKSIRIKYSDNGIGFDMEKISKNGVRNMENRMHSINGSITFDSEINKGVKINIEFPK